jgi:hypothetical protein
VRSKSFFIGFVFFSVAMGMFSACKNNSGSKSLSAKEQKAGWKLLFDGKSLEGWRNYKKPDGPKKGWIVENGILKLQPNGGGGDIITIEQFTDYDLRWDWRMAAKANNGLKYLVSEQRSAPGPEYQMIDDFLETEAKRMTASLYDILPPAEEKRVKPFGQWNRSRILVQGNHVEHWLNGKKVLAYELGSAELKAAIAKSKFKDVKDFGEKIKGHIMLTDHKDEVRLRNIRIRELPEK